MTTPNIFTARSDVAARIESSGSILLGLDFDGTLAALCDSPEMVVLDENVRARLGRLSRLDRVAVMILSGRSLTDVAERVGVPGLIYAGNHGFEIEGPGFSFVEPTAAASAPVLEKITNELQSNFSRWPGALVESKGLTTSVHFRLAPTKSWNDLAWNVYEVTHPLRHQFVVTTGHYVWEVRPRAEWHKGRALEWTSERLGDAADRLIFYLGDDRTDEDAFAALSDAITVKIGDARTEARYRLHDIQEVFLFLQWLESESPLRRRARAQGA